MDRFWQVVGADLVRAVKVGDGAGDAKLVRQHMLTVGIRELRQLASELLRQVEKGESIEITDRGRPVALLSPLPTGSPYRQLVAEGEIVRATGNLDDLPDPLPLPPGQESGSAVLARLRADER